MLCSPDGSWFSAVSESRQFGSTFGVEIWVIGLGLAHALRNGVCGLICASDCLKVVRILQRPVEVNTYWDRDAIQDVGDWLQRDSTITVTHFPRDQNNTA